MVHKDETKSKEFFNDLQIKNFTDRHTANQHDDFFSFLSMISNGNIKTIF